MAAMPDDIRDEIESAYGRRDIVTHAPRGAQSPEKSLHPLMRCDVSFSPRDAESVFFCGTPTSTTWLENLGLQTPTPALINLHSDSRPKIRLRL